MCDYEKRNSKDRVSKRSASLEARENWKRPHMCKQYRERDHRSHTSCSRLSSSASSLSLAAVNPGANLVEAASFGQYIGRDYGLSRTCSTLGASSGLKSIFGSWLVGEALYHEEHYKRCEHQNNRHCLFLRRSQLALDERR